MSIQYQLPKTKWQRLSEREQLKIRVYLSMAKEVAALATCTRAQIGCVTFDDQYRVLAATYNGAPAGHRHCFEVGCLMIEGHCKRTMHAERNAVLLLGDRFRGTNMVSEYAPCVDCATHLVAAGIQNFYHERRYQNDGDPGSYVSTLFKEAKANLIMVPERE